MRSTISELQAFANAVYGGQPALLTPYTYNIDFDAIAAAGTEYQQLQIQANADFILTSLNCQVATSVGNPLLFSAKCLITDNSSGEQFSNAPMLIPTFLVNASPLLSGIAVAATAQGVELPYPLFIQGRTSLTVMVQNTLLVATYTDLTIQLNGVLARKYSKV